MFNGKDESINLFRLSDIPQIELFTGRRITRSFSRHVHWVFSLGAVERGTRVIHHRGKEYRVKPGCISLISPGEVHSGGAADDDGYDNRSIRLQGDYYRLLASQITGWEDKLPCFPQPVYRDQELHQQVIDLHTLLGQKIPTLEKEYSLLNTLALLIQRYALEKPEPVLINQKGIPVQEVCSYIRNHFAENISLQELAQIAGLSPYHLARVFTEEVGIPPHEYQTQIRLNNALDLLSLKKPIIEVAVETGFFDQSHFTRAFKKKFGTTPGKFTTI